MNKFSKELFARNFKNSSRRKSYLWKNEIYSWFTYMIISAVRASIFATAARPMEFLSKHLCLAFRMSFNVI